MGLSQPMHPPQARPAARRHPLCCPPPLPPRAWRLAAPSPTLQRKACSTTSDNRRPAALPESAAPPSGEAAGSEYHAELARQWGERWPALFGALAAPTRHVALHNAFLGRPPAPADLPGAAPLAQHRPELAALLAGRWRGDAPASPINALHWEPANDDASSSYSGGGIVHPPPPADAATGLTAWYWLDAASLLPPLLLDVRPGQAVLDMCAAPGGKSLALAQLLLAAGPPAAAGAPPADAGAAAAAADAGAAAAAEGGSLVCNELDAGRRARLVRVLRSYVPEAVRRQHIRVTPYDAARWWGRQEAEAFDRVLLDAPCSSDRHVAQQAAARGSRLVTRADWSLPRCRRIAASQAKLLEAAAKALRRGGRLVYSTCSVAELQNDGVVERVLTKAGGSLAVACHGGGGGAAALAAAGAERTRHGWLVLPDGAAGAGPIYLSVLRKVARSDLRRVKVNKYAREPPPAL